MTSRTFVACLAAGFVIRLIVLWHTAALEARIGDEQHYVQLAQSLAEGRGFARETGELTSLRPPLYPAFVAAVWTLYGENSLQAVRVVQMGLAFVTALLTFQLGRRVADPYVARAATATIWLYPSLIFFNVTILTETLFTFVLVAYTLLAAALVQRPTIWCATGCGVALGLGALARSVLWPMPFLLCPLLVALLAGPIRRRAALAALVLAGYAVVVAPWAIRNTRLQGVTTIVDTMGGMNLRMGNYEHTLEERMWDTVSLTGERNWAYALGREEPVALAPGGVFTEGMKDRWAQRKAVEYILEHPGTTLRRAAIKFADFWGLERTYLAGVHQGLYSPPIWVAILAAIGILSSWVAVSAVGVSAAWLAPIDWRMRVLLILPIITIMGAHTIVFGHSRYHIPIVPLLVILAATFWRTHRATWSAAGWRTRVGAAASVAALLAVWLRQVLVVDTQRVLGLLGDFF